jgi:hypothetical protein
VHGPDKRVRITYTSVDPWRAHASLLITAADNSKWIGTGRFIGPRTHKTAAHVVHIKGSGVAGRDGWVTRIQVVPRRNRRALPYRSVDAGGEARVYITRAPGPAPDVATLSGADGRFTIAAGRPGVYEIACSADTQGLAVAKLQVGAKAGGDVELRLGGR